MKLLFVHQNLGEFGGAEAYVDLTAGALRDLGHSVALVYQQNTHRNESAWRSTFSECFYVPAPGNKGLLEAALDRFSPDLIFLHNWNDLEVLEQILDSGLPVVRMVHDHALYCMRSYKYNYFTGKICTRPASGYCVFPCMASVLRDRSSALGIRYASYAQKRREIRLNQRCAALLVYSNYQRQELLRNGFAPEKISICSPMRTQNHSRLTSSFTPRNLILFAGQIIRGKGVDALLRALARVQVNFECAILGDGNHRRHCERLCSKLALQNRVRFHGYVLPADMQQFYLEASVFAMASLWPEPFGMAGPEAMRYGLPVVAFNAGAIREWLLDGYNGFLVPWKDISSFAARLEQLLSDKKLARQMGQRALQSVERLDASEEISKLERVLSRACASRRLIPDSPIVLSNDFVSV